MSGTSLSEDETCFTWRDAGRTVLFGQGSLEKGVDVLAEQGIGEFALLTTARALADAGRLAAAAASTHEVGAGPVPETAAALLGRLGAPAVVALGGGRVIDAAKAIAAVEGQTVVAMPTTLSGAEMTGIHRLPAGAEQRAHGLVRPSLALADSDLMTSLPEPELRHSAMNALAHGADSLYTPFANPVSRMTALRGATLIGEALDQPREQRDRPALALGSLLCGYAIDSGLFAIHHVICQTLVRALEIPHAPTNAAILPETMAFMRARAREQMDQLASVLGTDLDSLPQRIRELGHPPRLRDLGTDRDRLDDALTTIEQRPELQFTPEPPDRDQLRALIEAAW